MVWFIESLTVRTWCVRIAPRLLWHRLRGGAGVRCRAIEWSSAGLLVAQRSAAWVGATVDDVEFQLRELRDADGRWLQHRVAAWDLTDACEAIMADPLVRRAIDAEADGDALAGYLRKALASVSFMGRGTLWRAILLVQICGWAVRRTAPGARCTLFMQRQAWWSQLATHAARHGVTVRALSPPWDPIALVRRRLPAPWYQACRRWLGRVEGDGHGTLPKPCRGRPVDRALAARARLGVEYYGQLNLDHPECYSDLFFLPPSGIAASDVVALFGLAVNPLDAGKRAELERHGVQAVAIHEEACVDPEAPVVTGSHPRVGSARVTGGDGASVRWLAQQRRAHDALRRRWSDAIAACGLKLYVTWYKYSADHAAIAGVLRAAGGAMVMYQRAYEGTASPETAVFADVMFGLSPQAAAVERASGSVIRYHVTTGYLGDHRFALVRPLAAALRERLQAAGARRVIAFTDENSKPDSRWQAGQAMMRENYAFLLEQVLREPWLGVLFKPKVSRTLRARLGPVAPLLAQAEATGRCLVLEGGALHNPHPPALASLAADVSIHSHLSAATAGLEAALAGVPSLLLDREGWDASPLYQLGRGSVVFHDWMTAWQACAEHWSRPGGVPGFGDWSGRLERIDPFRDGQAAARMGQYLRWLLDGFQAGGARETVLADAAERYAARWGRGTIQAVNAEAIAWPVPAASMDPAPAAVEAR